MHNATPPSATGLPFHTYYTCMPGHDQPDVIGAYLANSNWQGIGFTMMHFNTKDAYHGASSALRINKTHDFIYIDVKFNVVS